MAVLEMDYMCEMYVFLRSLFWVYKTINMSIFSMMITSAPLRDWRILLKDDSFNLFTWFLNMKMFLFLTHA